MVRFSLPSILLLFTALAISQVLGFTACISPRPIFNDGLCYPGCSPDFSGIGPLCWSQQTCGPFHIDTGAFCHKKSYGRGAGVPLSFFCRSHEELNGLLCYDRCRSGYYGVGPVCWQRCPDGYADHGLTCFKSIFDFFFKGSYGRGVGRAADNGCRSGYERNLALCYPVCRSGYTGVGPVCWATGCPRGMTDIGVSCAKETKGRGVGTVPTNCNSSDFNRDPAPNPSITNPFTMIIANDPQLIWWEDPPGAAACKGEGNCKRRNAESEALNQVKAMNAIQSLGTWPGTTRRISKPAGVIINGDLTQYFHPHEFDLFEKYYIKGSNAPHTDVLQYPVYLGLGNHDYDNNLDGCWWPREPRYGVLLANGCAQKAVDYIKGMISCGRIPTFPGSQIASYHAASLAYSWNMGKYHFIQLQNYPSYTVPSIGISSSMGWLEEDLKKARAANKHIIVNLHDLFQHFKSPERDSFQTLLDTYKVAGLFCGHAISNSNLGYQGNFGTVPYFRGGHGGEVNRNKFLLVEFAETSYRVLSITSSDGSPKLVSVHNSNFDRTIHL